MKTQPPDPSFLFVGPTGVGNKLAKTLAYELFGSKDAMIRLDMSEYGKTQCIKLIGSPPGYVGYEEPAN